MPMFIWSGRRFINNSNKIPPLEIVPMLASSGESGLKPQTTTLLQAGSVSWLLVSGVGCPAMGMG